MESYLEDEFMVYGFLDVVGEFWYYPTFIPKSSESV